MQIAVFVLLAAILAALILLLLRKNGSSGIEEITRLRTIGEERERQIAELKHRSEKSDELLAANSRLEAELVAERKSSLDKLALLQESELRLKTEFENLANRIFEEKGRAFTLQNSEKLTGLLTPFREQIELFRNRVDEVHRNDTESRARLLEQVRQLQELNTQVSREANNLAEAIKGDAKAQGNWGELIIERIFEASGLEPGREYEAQAGLRSDDGRLLKPDFIVYLPGDKAVIVDSKVSLTAYERFCNDADPDTRERALADHLASIRNHVDELKAKEYQQLLGNRTLDFVIMCVPVEGAYQLAFREDPSLLYDIAKTGLIVVGPATLMLALKLIAQIWRREKENRNAELIADRAGRLYDHVALVYESMSEASKRLGGVQDSFDTAMKRLKDGKGSLMTRVEELRKLGAKTSRQLPPDTPASLTSPRR